MAKHSSFSWDANAKHGLILNLDDGERMPTRNQLQRIERAEKALEAQSIFSLNCICFPENERPTFGFPIEREIAAEIKCSLHGERFVRLFHLYVPKWLRGNLWRHLPTHRSAQYRKAWLAGFPPHLWPAEEQETEDGDIFLKLKDGTRVMAYKPAWRTQRPHE